MHQNTVWCDMKWNFEALNLLFYSLKSFYANFVGIELLYTYLFVSIYKSF